MKVKQSSCIVSENSMPLYPGGTALENIKQHEFSACSVQ